MILYNFLIKPISLIYMKALRMCYTRRNLEHTFKTLVVCTMFVIILFIYKRSGKQHYLWYDVVYQSLDYKTLSIAVVEEHHEVLPYWFASTDKKQISSAGNILVHIDAHADTGVPAYDPILSQFKIPKTGEHIQSMMQRNDVFIMGAAYKGLISKIIWVYPDWLNVTDFGPSAITGQEIKAKLGFYDRFLNGKLLTGFCACYIVRAEQPSECDFIDPAGALLQNFEVYCQPYKTVSMHFVKSSLASKLIPRLLSSSQSDVILDIDEDYYGVMKGSDLLEGIDFRLVAIFNNLLSKLFTILSVKDESNANKLLLNILHLVKVTCYATIGDKRDCSREHFRKIQRFLTESGLEDTLIGNRKLSSEALSQLVQYISEEFSAQNIDQLSQVGFCLRVSPLTYKLKVDASKQIDYERITVCHGINTPYSDNQIMVPKVASLGQTTNVLTGILDLIPTKSVKLVTVARSNRDGFTPRHLQQTIEEQILQSLKRKFINSKVIHDPNLMLHLGQGILDVNT